MRDSKKKKWTKPKVMRFESAQDVRLYYQGKGTPAQREALDEMIEGTTPAKQRRMMRRG